MPDSPTPRPSILLTGATGLIGHHVLARLLTQGRRVVVLLRHGDRDLPRLEALLAPLHVDVNVHLGNGQLVPVQGDLCNSMDALPVNGEVGDVLHIAACTRFVADRAGDPYRTNVQGTVRLLEWATTHNVHCMQLVSTAYVCGFPSPGEVIPECVDEQPRSFHNDYERSKWSAEQLCRSWASMDARRTLTVMRPSIVVGEFETGRTTKFSGFYLTLRAAEAVARMQCESAHTIERVRLRGRPNGRQNIVPVDYVAEMITAIVSDVAHWGRVYHLVHASPPQNDAIQRAVEEHLGMQCAEFAGENLAGERNRLERVFDRLASTVEPYILDTPHFDRRNTEAVERIAGITCPDFSHESLLRLCRFATSCRWQNDRPAETDGSSEGDPAEYFDHFLPENLVRSRVAKMNSLCAIVRFVLTDMDDGQWVCRFDRGRMAQIHRGSNGLKEDFGYRTTRDVFCRAVAGTIDPQQAFLSRQAEMFGDIERALKMAMVFREFHRECPFPQEAACA